MERVWDKVGRRLATGISGCVALAGWTVLTGCASTGTTVIRQLPSPIVATLPVTKIPPSTPPAVKARPGPTRTADAAHNWVPRGGIKDRWNYIVIHHSASDVGNATEFDRYHRNVNHWDELGYHFVIGNGTRSGNGLVEVGPRWKKQKVGAHCKTSGNMYNERGIGICLVGNFENNKPTPPQMRSLVRLVRFLMRSGNVASENVVTHKGVTGRTECPGAHFPWKKFRRMISEPASASVMR